MFLDIDYIHHNENKVLLLGWTKEVYLNLHQQLFLNFNVLGNIFTDVIILWYLSPEHIFIGTCACHQLWQYVILKPSIKQKPSESFDSNIIQIIKKDNDDQSIEIYYFSFHIFEHVFKTCPLSTEIFQLPLRKMEAKIVRTIIRVSTVQNPLKVYTRSFQKREGIPDSASEFPR